MDPDLGRISGVNSLHVYCVYHTGSLVGNVEKEGLEEYLLKLEGSWGGRNEHLPSDGRAGERMSKEFL